MTLLTQAQRNAIDSEFETISHTTIAQQKAKRATVDILLEEDLPIPSDLRDEFHDYIQNAKENPEDGKQIEINQLVNALAEFMSFDKGPDEEEYYRLCNAALPLVQKHNRFVYVQSYGDSDESGTSGRTFIG